MTEKELIELAKGCETGYYDREGNPIKIGDFVCIYHLPTEYIKDPEELEHIDDKYFVNGYNCNHVYTGRVIREYGFVEFSFRYGWNLPRGYYNCLYKNKQEYEDLPDRCFQILVCKNREDAPKLSFEDVRVK